MCAAPRADHLLRTLPPDLSASYARGTRPRRRSLAVSARASWRAGRPRSRSRCRTTPGALAGAPRRTRTPMCGARRSCRILGCVGRRFARSAAASPRGCCALSGRTRSRLSILCPLLARCRCSWRPLHPRRMGGWSAIHDGLRPAQCDLPEPGERCQGWQHHGSRACSSLPHQADVGPMDPAAAPRSMFTVITMLPAPAPAFSPGEPSHSSARGYGSCAKQSGQRARSFCNSGSFRTPAPGVDPDDRRRLDFVAYGATWCHAARRSTVLRRDPGLAADTRWPPAILLNHQGRRRPGHRRTPQARCLPRAPSARTATAVRAGVRDRRALERRVAPPRRAARPFAYHASPCSAPRSCHPGLVQTLVGPTQRGCAKHTCCHFARVAARPCPYARRAGAASAGRPARRVPARAQLPAGSLSRCSPPCSAVARRCTGTARGSPERPWGKTKKNVRKTVFSRGKIKDKTMFFRRKTKENHTKSVQNVRKLVFSLGKTKEKQKKEGTKKIHPL